MPAGVPVRPGLKKEILRQIQEEGMSVLEAHRTYRVSRRTIYNWLYHPYKEIDRNVILENNRLKKELDVAYDVIRRMREEISRPKGS